MSLASSEQVIMCQDDEIGTSFVVAYAKITTDKQDVNLQGVYLGGVGASKNEAEQIARECVNSIKGGTILPRIVQTTGRETVLNALFQAADKFEAVTQNMKETAAILSRPQRNNRT